MNDGEEDSIWKPKGGFILTRMRTCRCLHLLEELVGDEEWQKIEGLDPPLFF